MENGVYELTSGIFTSINSRSEINSVPVQSVLHRNHRTQNLVCACGMMSGKNLILEPRRYGSSYTIARDDISGHSPFCFLQRLQDNAQLNVSRSIDIFSIHKENGNAPLTALVKSNLEITSHPQNQVDNYHTYCRRVISLGLAEAFIYANTNSDKLSNPEAVQVLRQIGIAINHFKFGKKIDGYEAARINALTLRFGLVFDQVENEGDPIDCFNAYWFDTSKNTFSRSLTAGHPAAMHEAIDHLKVFNNYKKPPYFIIALQDQKGRLQRIFFHKIIVHQSFLISVESSAEENYGINILKKGGAVISVIKWGDFTRVLESFGFRLPPGEKWRYRPDFFALNEHPISGDKILHIREVRGFKPGTFPIYDAPLLSKADYYSNLFPGKSIYREVDGTSPTPPITYTPPDRWQGVECTFEPPAADLFPCP